VSFDRSTYVGYFCSSLPLLLWYNTAHRMQADDLFPLVGAKKRKPGDCPHPSPRDHKLLWFSSAEATSKQALVRMREEGTTLVTAHRAVMAPEAGTRLVRPEDRRSQH
jgi:hypothetical protein